MNGCNGRCNQGRMSCPTPQACEISDEEGKPTWGRVALLVAAAFLVALSLLAFLP